MRRAPLFAVRPGDVLGAPIFDERGSKLVSADLLLTHDLISSLERRGIFVVYLRNGEADDIMPADIVSAPARAQFVEQLSGLHGIIRKAAANAMKLGRRPSFAGVGIPRPVINSVIKLVDLLIEDVLNFGVLTTISSLKGRDDYVQNHAIDVAAVALLIGKRLGLKQSSLKQLAIGCLFQDIGMLFLPEELLAKSGDLTPDEILAIQSHTTEGYEFLQATGFGDGLASYIALQHHERQDGSGYPFGLTGSNAILALPYERRDPRRIFPLAEIATLADVWSALLSDRPYRLALRPERAAAQIKQLAGYQLSADLAAFVRGFLPVFAVGIDVELSGGWLDGYTGIVIENRIEVPAQPLVKVLRDPAGRPLCPEVVDPRDEGARVVSPKQAVAAH